LVFLISPFIPANPKSGGWRLIGKGSVLFSFDIEYTRRVKVSHRTDPGRRTQWQAFTPAMILFISFTAADDKTAPG
jgi:hypothetical protein